MEFFLENTNKIEEFILIEVEFIGTQSINYDFTLQNSYTNATTTLPNTRLLYTSKSTLPEIFNNGTGSWLARLKIHDNSSDGIMWISYITDKSVMELMTGEIKFFEIQAKMQRYFKFECDGNVSEVTFIIKKREYDYVIIG